MGKQIATIARFTGPRSRIYDRLLPQTCKIYPPDRTIDEAGSYSTDRSATPVAYNGSYDIPCRLDVTRYYRQAELFGQEAIVSDYEIHVPYDVELHHDYDIEFEGEFYQIRKILDDDGTWRPDRSALVSRVGQGTST